MSADPKSAERMSPTSRVVPLDGLRTVAIVLVVLYHLHVPFFTGGFIGVNIFYVLSGYLITSILLRERDRTGRIRLGRFWLRRFLRLYPVLLAVVIVAVCLWFIVGDYSGANVGVWEAAALALTYTSNFGRWLAHTSIGVLAQTWSLAMEEQFYLVWPPILALLLAIRARRRPLMIVLSALVVASAVGGWLIYAPRAGGATPDVYFSPVLNVAPLLMGVILALALTDERVRSFFAGVAGELSTWVGLAGLVVIDLTLGSGWQDSAATFAVVLPLSGLATAVLLAGLVNRRTVVARALSFSPIAWFGRNGSYSLYLWHVLVIALVRPLIPGDLGKGAAFAIAIAVAIASHFVIERPFLRLKDRLEPSRAAPVVAVSPERELVSR